MKKQIALNRKESMTTDQKNNNRLFLNTTTSPVDTQKGLLDIFQALISKKALNRTQHKQLIQIIQKNPQIATITDPKNRTPLHWAAINGHTGLIRDLISAGANINAMDNEGKTALHFACLHGHLNILNILKKAQATITIKDHDGNTPLHLACAQKEPKIVKQLIKAGAKRHRQNSQRDTPLHIATRYGHNDIIKILLKHGTQINRRNNEGNTPFHIAARYGHITILKTLSKQTRHIQRHNNGGETPLDLAFLYGHKQTMITLNKLQATQTSKPWGLMLNKRHQHILMRNIKKQLKATQKKLKIFTTQAQHHLKKEALIRAIKQLLIKFSAMKGIQLMKEPYTTTTYQQLRKQIQKLLSQYKGNLIVNKTWKRLTTKTLLAIIPPLKMVISQYKNPKSLTYNIKKRVKNAIQATSKQPLSLTKKPMLRMQRLTFNLIRRRFRQRINNPNPT